MAVLIELRQAAPVEILKVGVRTGERKVDVIDDRRIPRAWFARRSGHQSFGECRNRGSVALVEKCAVPLPVGPRLGSGRRLRGRVLFLIPLSALRHQSRAGNGPRAGCCAGQEFTSRCVTLAHGCLAVALRL